MSPTAFIPSTPFTPLRRPRAPTPIIRTSTTPQANLTPPLQSLSKALAATAASLMLTLPTALPTPPAYAARGGGASFLSASGDVIKDPESLLRWALPISNKPVRELQAELEGAVSDLKGLKWNKVEGHVRNAMRVLKAQQMGILSDVPTEAEEEAKGKLAEVLGRMGEVESAVAERSAEKVTKVCRELLRQVGDVEQSMVRVFPYDVPQEFDGLPQLKGRATVEMVVRKGGEEQFDIDGVLLKEGTLRMVLDGYSAPVSAGAFADLVEKGFYDGSSVIRSDGFIVQAGAGKGGEEGYVEDGVTRTIPLEVFARGDDSPIYGVTLEEDGRGSVGTVLPFSAYGTVAMARKEFENDSASSQFFWFLFEPDLTPAGRNLMDGSWGVFGYTTEGGRFLRGVQKGDVIVSAKIVQGGDKLVPGIKQVTEES